MRFLLPIILFLGLATYLQFSLDQSSPAASQQSITDWAKTRIHQNTSPVQLESLRTTGSLRLRQGPTTQAEVVTGMSNNQRVAFLGCAKGGWVKISTGSHLGYAHGNFLRDGNRNLLSQRCNS